jgi:hypothetical protein
MKATDFDLRKDLKFDPESGFTTFRDSRVIILDANAMGLLRQQLVEELGFDGARRFFLRFGFQHGLSDFLQMKISYEFDSEMDLLASGPVIHTWEGIVQASPRELRFDRKTGEFLFTGVWTNSYEAQQHLSYNPTQKEPMCWTLMGYASGWCTGFFGELLVAIEPVCLGKGDDHCEWKIQPPAAWGKQAEPYIEAYQELVGGTYGRKAA